MILEDKDYKRLDNESEEDYQYRICGLKEAKGLTWDEITVIINRELDFNYSESRYRRQYKAYVQGYKTKEKEIGNMTPQELDEFTLKQINMQKERMRLSDVRVQYNAEVREMARVDTMRELLTQCAEVVSKSKPLIIPEPITLQNEEKTAILCLSDLHYGIEFNNFLNKYSPQIARDRMALLTTKTLEYCRKEGVKHLIITNLGDMIAGLIHLQIRLGSRENVVQQTMSAAEIIAEMIHKFSQELAVEYFDCLDNHSRVDANKATSMGLESYSLFIPWYLKSRFYDNPNVIIYDSNYDAGIIKFNCLGHNIIGVHGHQDKPGGVVKELSALFREPLDLILMGHRHHFGADEQLGAVVLMNGTIMGTDDYAKDLRLSSHATQNLIIVTKDTPCEVIYRIVLD